MKVYRVETYYGIGPYNRTEFKKLIEKDWEDEESQGRYKLSQDLHEAHRSQGTHPGRYDDFVVHNLFIQNWDNYLCGFLTLEDYKSWFRGFIKRLAKYNFYVTEYYALQDNIIYGYSLKQLMFKPPTELLRRLHPLTLEEINGIQCQT